MEKAKIGSLKGYHTRLIATNRQNVHRNIMREIRYLVLTVRDSTQDTEQLGKYLYSVASVKLLPRRDIDKEITGKDSDALEKYWVFEFSGAPVLLPNTITKPYEEHFNFKLIQAERLPDISHWGEIQGNLELYKDLSPIW